MATPPVIARGVPSRKRPQAYPDGLRDGADFRSARYGEEFNVQLHQKSHTLADEGSYWFTSNPTSGTGVSTSLTPTAAPAIGGNDTKPYLVIQNQDSPSDPAGRRTYLDYLRLRCTAIGTAGASVNLCIITDVAGANRAPQSVTPTRPTNPNMDDNTLSACQVWAGAVTVGTTNSGRLFPNLQFRSTIGVIGDLFVVSFGPTEYPVGSLVSTSNTTMCQQSFGHPPVVIGPGQWALIFLWLPSQTAACAFEYDLGGWDR